VKGDLGPAGPPGPQGVQGIDGADGVGVDILGSYNSFADLTSAHPTGNVGDAYLVNGNLYVWSVNSGRWENVGNIQGPQGVQGVQGVKGDPGPIGPQGIQGVIGDLGPAGPVGPLGPIGPPGPQSLTIIPFASRTASRTGTNTAGNPTTVSLITYGGDPHVITLGSNGTVTLGNGGQAVFSLPFDVIIESIYICIGNLSDFTVHSGATAYPFVELFAAAPASNIFTELSQTKVVPSTGFSGLTHANTMREASVDQIGVRLNAGMRILIGGQMQVTGSGALAQVYYFYYTGGIALRPA
jgi:hypothetical protein